jgi:hypothetical protein
VDRCVEVKKVVDVMEDRKMKAIADAEDMDARVTTQSMVIT